MNSGLIANCLLRLRIVFSNLMPMVGMVACGQGVAIMPQLLLTRPSRETGVQVLALEPAAGRSIGLACLDKNGLSPAAREFARRVRDFSKTF